VDHTLRSLRCHFDVDGERISALSLCLKDKYFEAVSRFSLAFASADSRRGWEATWNSPRAPSHHNSIESRLINKNKNKNKKSLLLPFLLCCFLPLNIRLRACIWRVKGRKGKGEERPKRIELVDTVHSIPNKKTQSHGVCTESRVKLLNI